MIAAVLYIAGAALVLVAAFLPIATRVYGRPVEQAIAAVEAAPGAWRVHHVLFALGATVTAVASLWEALGPGRAALTGAAVAFGLGAVFFLSFLAARATTPARTWFEGEVGNKRFLTYTALTMLGLVLRGLGAVQAGHGAGWALAGYGALLMLLAAWLRDMPPFAHYLGTLGLGIALL